MKNKDVNQAIQADWDNLNTSNARGKQHNLNTRPVCFLLI